MSQSRQHRIGIILENVAHGTTPGSGTILALEGGPFSPSLSAPKAISDAIRNDANVKSSVALNRSAAISRSQELVYPTVNEGLWTEIRAGLRASAEQAQTSVSAQLQVNTATIVDAGNQWVASGYQPGDVVKVSGALGAIGNGYYRVTTVTAGTLTVAIPDAGVFSSTETATIKLGARMVNGTTARSYSVEECWLDTQKMMVWNGQRVTSLSLGFSMGSKSSIAIGYVGWDGTPGTMNSPTVGIAGTTYGSYTESPVFSPADSIDLIVNNETLPVSSFTVTTDVGGRVRHSTVGGAVPDAIPTGSFRCSVSVTAYASVLSLLTQYRAGTKVPVMCAMEDPNGKAIAVTLGTVVWDSGSLPTDGIDSDAMISVSGTATLTTAVDGNDQNWTMRFLRFQ